MPLLRIVTNVERKSIPDNFLEEATDMLAQAIGKPREVYYTSLDWGCGYIERLEIASRQCPSKFMPE